MDAEAVGRLGAANPVVCTKQPDEADDNLGGPGPRDYAELARWNHENRDFILAMYDQLYAPTRVRYLPQPRLRIYRPNVGRSSRGRRVRTAHSSRGAPGRKPGGSDDPHPDMN